MIYWVHVLFDKLGPRLFFFLITFLITSFITNFYFPFGGRMNLTLKRLPWTADGDRGGRGRFRLRSRMYYVSNRNLAALRMDSSITSSVPSVPPRFCVGLQTAF